MSNCEYNVYCQGGFGNHLMAYSIALILCQYIKGTIIIHSNAIPNDCDVKRNDTRTALLQIAKPFIVNNLDVETSQIKEYYLHNLNDFRKVKEIFIQQNPNEFLKHTRLRIHIYLITVDLNEYHIHRKLICEYLLFTSVPLIDVQPTDIIISFRLGIGSSEVSPEAFQIVHRIPMTYYMKVLKKIYQETEIKRLIICADNFEDPYITDFTNLDIHQKREIVYARYNTVEQFQIFLRAKRIVSSNSSFSVMASILSNTETVYFPLFPKSHTIYNDPIHDPGLILNVDQDKYHYVFVD